MASHRVVVRGRARSTGTSRKFSGGKLGQPPLEKTAFGLLLCEVQGAPERSARLGGATEAAAELGARRVGEAVVAKVAAGEDAVDQLDSGRRAIAHGHRDGAVQLDDRRRSEEHTSELQSQSKLVCRLLLEKKRE